MKNLTKNPTKNTGRNSVGMIASLLICAGGSSLSSAIAAPKTIAQTPSSAQPIFFRTKSYGVQIIWRGGRPYLTVSNNGWRVLANSPAAVSPQSAVSDRWTTYLSRSGDYRVAVQVGPGGAGAIEVSLEGGRIAREIALFPPPRPDQAPRQLKDGTILEFQTPDYAVRVYQQKGKPYLNLYEIKNARVTLNQVPVMLSERSEGTVYQYDGETTVQAREDSRGRRSLWMMKDNQIIYRGEGV